MRTPIKIFLGTVKLVSPASVRARLSAMGSVGDYQNGAIFVECKEANFVGTDLIFCRYGLSLPYLRVAVGQDVWIQPTIEGFERWIYTGFADAPYDNGANDLLFLGSEDDNQYVHLTTTKLLLRHSTAAGVKSNDGSGEVSHNQHIHPTPFGPSGPPTVGT